MMHINDLRIGNMVSLAYNPGVITAVIAIEFGGAIQMACNNYTDDIRDIEPIPLNSQTLNRFAIPVRIIHGNVIIDITCKNNNVHVSGTIFSHTVPIHYLHELQNMVFLFTQTEIIDHKKFRL